MGQGTITFELPEEEDEFVQAANWRNTWLALCEIEEMFRKKDKYEELGEKEKELVQKMRQEFYSILDSYHVNLGA